jgi:galactose oxidase
MRRVSLQSPRSSVFIEGFNPESSNMTMMHLVRRAAIVLSLSIPLTAEAQVREVVVGITPTCPYGLTGCWGGASEGLSRLAGVESVGKSPDGYNSTAYVYLEDRDSLPDVEKWTKEFKTTANEAYGFRGVEVTVEVDLSTNGDALFLQLPNEKGELRLTALKHKLQWNFKKRAPRQPEPDEAAAYDSLRAAVMKAGKAGLRVMVTGPLVKYEDQPALEVREFFPVNK